MSETSEFVHHIVLIQALVVEGGLDCHSLRAGKGLPVIDLILLHVLNKPHKLALSGREEDIRWAGDVD